MRQVFNLQYGQLISLILKILRYEAPFIVHPMLNTSIMPNAVATQYMTDVLWAPFYDKIIVFKNTRRFGYLGIIKIKGKIK